MENTPIDIILSDISAVTDDRDFEFYFQNKKVGKSSISLFTKAWGMCGRQQFFPDSWFNKSREELRPYGVRAPLKPFLEITNFDFSDFQGRGFGRMGLQKMYQLSLKLGAEGRISLVAQKKKTSLRSPAPFYEFCGFKGTTVGKEERKYFDPTPENLKILFSRAIHPSFRVQELPTEKEENLFINRQTGQINIPQVLREFLLQHKR